MKFGIRPFSQFKTRPVQWRCLDSAHFSAKNFAPSPPPRREPLTLSALVTPSHYFSPQTTFLSAEQLQSFPSQPQTVNGATLQFLTARGVFAREGVDEGTRILLNHWLAQAPPEYSGRVADLGCGWGALAAFVAARFAEAQVYAVDINPRAVQVCAHNLYRNELTNAHAFVGDGLRAARAECFDDVLCNPPIRAGNAAIGKLFEDAHRTLKLRGELWAVIRTAQGAKSWAKRLQESWGNCETVALDKGYRVLRSRKGA